MKIQYLILLLKIYLYVMKHCVWLYIVGKIDILIERKKKFKIDILIERKV